jgi:Fe-S cluster assembly iron-binding protein IscA
LVVAEEHNKLSLQVMVDQVVAELFQVQTAVVQELQDKDTQVVLLATQVVVAEVDQVVQVLQVAATLRVLQVEQDLRLIFQEHQ